MKNKLPRTSTIFMVLLSVALLLTSASFGLMASTGKPIMRLDLRHGVATDFTLEKKIPLEELEKRGKYNFGNRVTLTALSHHSPWRAVMMLSGCGCFEIEVNTRGVSGWWIDLANARDCDGGGGGYGASNYCSELQIMSHRLGIFGNAANLGPGFHNCPLGGRYIQVDDFVGSSDTVTMQVHNGYVRVESSNGNKVALPEGGGRPCVFACGGQADQNYWLGINRVVKRHDGPPTRVGDGVMSVTIYYMGNYNGCCGCS